VADTHRAKAKSKQAKVNALDAALGGWAGTTAH
jgi:hypothetical protein